MAAVAIKTGPGVLTIGSDTDLTQFEQQITSASLEPSFSSGDDTLVLSGDTVAGADTETWTLKGKMNSDLGTSKSAQEFCFTNSGKVLPFNFTPSTEAGKAFTGTLKVRATAFGGDVGQNSNVDFEFPCVGKPDLGAVAS